MLGWFLINIFLLECAVLEAAQIDFYILRPLSCIDWGSLHSPTFFFLALWAEVSGKKKKKNVWISDKMQSGLSGRSACVERGRKTSFASSIRVKTLFGECLSYWLCISLVTWSLCCIGVMHGHSQRVEQSGDERGARTDFGKQRHMMF